MNETPVNEDDELVEITITLNKEEFDLMRHNHIWDNWLFISQGHKVHDQVQELYPDLVIDEPHVPDVGKSGRRGLPLDERGH